MWRLSDREVLLYIHVYIYIWTYIYMHSLCVYYIYMCAYVYIHPHACIHIWRALFQNALSSNPKINVAMPMLSSEVMFWKRSHTCIHMQVYMWKVLYQNAIFDLGIGITSSFSGMVLNAFWKRALHNYIHLCKYIYSHIHVYAVYIYTYAQIYTALCAFMCDIYIYV